MKHKVIDTHEGQIIVRCPVTKETYRYVINCPNTNYIVCKGCKERL